MKLQKKQKSEEQNMKLSEKILYCRKKAGYSQETLAQVLGISRQAVSKWETGESEPEAGKLKLLADTFNVTTDWLLSDDEPIIKEETSKQSSTQTVNQNSGQSIISDIGRVLRKYGWIIGIVISAYGCIVAIMGLVARHNALSMLQFDFMPEEMIANNPMVSMTTFMIVCGIVMIIVGGILAFYLKRRFSNVK